MRDTAKHCRSELAREELEDTAFIQDGSVIVNAHREQARSYKVISGYYRTSSSSTSNTSTLCGGMLPTP
ncbi:hypothetical protein C8K63_103401 [Pseudomonas sp. GV085]|nr:hypothetical protein C8K63_103401 [Pseudomonas sp. GV085]